MNITGVYLPAIIMLGTIFRLLLMVNPGGTPIRCCAGRRVVLVVHMVIDLVDSPTSGPSQADYLNAKSSPLLIWDGRRYGDASWE